ncbi:MAG: hypothetical protein AB1507_08905, partial [Bacillota bacterium]
MQQLVICKRMRPEFSSFILHPSSFKSCTDCPDDKGTIGKRRKDEGGRRKGEDLQQLVICKRMRPEFSSFILHPSSFKSCTDCPDDKGTIGKRRKDEGGRRKGEDLRHLVICKQTRPEFSSFILHPSSF